MKTPIEKTKSQLSEEPHSDTRSKIVEAARAEFARHGQAGARVDRIARSAGVNKAMIYYHFPSKEALYDETVAGFFAVVAAELKQRLEAGISIEERVTAVVEFQINLLARNEDQRRIVLRELADPDSKMVPKIAEIISQSGVLGQFRRAVRSGIRRGELREVNVKQTLASLVCMNVGFMLLAPVLKHTLEISDMKRFIAGRKEAVMDLFTRGVKKI